MRTSDFRVHAIGDCAQHPGTISGLVQPAWEQAAVLADLLTGARPAARYRGTPVVTRLKAKDVDLAALGDVHAEVDSPDAEVLCLTDPTRGRYAKLVLRDDRVTGAIVLGAPDAAATITQLYDRGIPAAVGPHRPAARPRAATWRLRRAQPGRPARGDNGVPLQHRQQEPAGEGMARRRPRRFRPRHGDQGHHGLRRLPRHRVRDRRLARQPRARTLEETST